MTTHRCRVALEWSDRAESEVLAAGMDALGALGREFSDPSLARREAGAVTGGTVGDGSADMRGLLLAENCAEWDRSFLLRFCVAMLAAATGHPARQVVYVVDDLYTWIRNHPENRARAFDETFLRAAMDEAVRLHVTGSPILVRRAREDVTLSTGGVITSGQKVGLDLVAANRDRAAFGDDAGSFDPWRGQGHVEGVPHHGVGFGHGAHHCIGRPLALGSSTAGVDGLELAMLRALYAREIEPDPTSPARLTEGGQEYLACYPARLRVGVPDRQRPNLQVIT